MKRRTRHFLNLCAGAALSMVMAAGAAHACTSYRWASDSGGTLRCYNKDSSGTGCSYWCSCSGTCGSNLYQAVQLKPASGG